MLLRCTDKAIAIDPNDTLALTNKGNVLSNLGKYQDAIALYDKALATDLNFTGALTNKGNVLNDLGKYTKMLLRCTTKL